MVISSRTTFLNSYKRNLIDLFYLLISADGNASSKEMEFGTKMMVHEKINEIEFTSRLKELESISKDVTLSKAIQELKKLPIDLQQRSIGWLCMIGNCDGFMDSREWALIYKLYSVELHLETPNVLAEQKRISKELTGHNAVSFGIRVN
jgi:uncharacterized tellurite resistance protein B-like protein